MSKACYTPSEKDKLLLEAFTRSLIATDDDEINWSLLDKVPLNALQWFTGQYARILAEKFPVPQSHDEALDVVRSQIDHAEVNYDRAITFRSNKIERESESNDALNAGGIGERQLNELEVSPHINRRKVHYFRIMAGWKALSTTLLDKGYHSLSGADRDKACEFLNERGKFYYKKHGNENVTEEKWIQQNYYIRSEYTKNRTTIFTDLSPDAQHDIIEYFKGKYGEPGAYFEARKRPDWISLEGFDTVCKKRFIIPQGALKKYIKEKTEQVIEQYARDNDVDIEKARQHIYDTYIWHSKSGVKRCMLSPQAQKDIEAYCVEKFPPQRKNWKPITKIVSHYALPQAREFIEQECERQVKLHMESHSISLEEASKFVKENYAFLYEAGSQMRVFLSEQAEQDLLKALGIKKEVDDDQPARSKDSNAR